MAGELILVIEDNVLNRKLARDVLQAQGYRVLETDTAEAGLELARARRPALILMDIQLPGMDGASATRVLRSDPTIRDIRVIAVTASVLEVQTPEVMSAGFDGMQMKPISVAGLLDEVRRVLEQATPATLIAPASDGRTPMSNPPSARDGHVLVVDDTAQNVKLLPTSCEPKAIAFPPPRPVRKRLRQSRPILPVSYCST
jgi:two-component system cell cycle response regulator DivK